MVFAPDTTCSGTWVGLTGVIFASLSVISTAALAAALLLVPHLRRRLSTRLALVLAFSLGLTWAAGIANYALDCPAWSVFAAALGLIATMLWQLVLALDFASVALRPAARGSANTPRGNETAFITMKILQLFLRCTCTDSRRVERLYHYCVWLLTIVLGVPLVLYIWFRVYATSPVSAGGAVHENDANSTASDYGGCGSLFVILLNDDDGAVFYGYNITLLLIELVLCCVVVTLRTRCVGALCGAHGTPLLVMDWRQRERVVVTTRMLLAFVVAWAPFIASNGARLRGMHTLPCWLQTATATLFCGQGLILFVIFGFGRPHYAMYRFASKLHATCCPHEIFTWGTSTSASGSDSASAGLLTFDGADDHLMCGDDCHGAGATARHGTDDGTLKSLQPLLSGAQNIAALADFRERDSFIAPDRFCLDPRDVQCETQPFAAGGGGMIYHGSYSGHRVCIKQLYVQVMDPLAVDDFLREASMLAKLRHKHIVHMWGICVIRNVSSQRIGIVMELCTGSLRDAIPAVGPPPKLPPGALATSTSTAVFDHTFENILAQGSTPRTCAGPGPACPGFLRFMQQLTHTMADVHAQQVCHRDLKPDNVLVIPAHDEDLPGGGSDASAAPAVELYDIRICDWGTSRLLGRTGTMPRHAVGDTPLASSCGGTESRDDGSARCSLTRKRAMSLIGTPGFAPPEVMTATARIASRHSAMAQSCAEDDQRNSCSSASRACSDGRESYGSEGSEAGEGSATAPALGASRAAQNSGGLGSQASYDGCAWDVYTVAVTMWFCYVGRDPYADLPNSGDISQAVCAGRRPPLSGVPPRLAELLNSMWHANPEARPCMADVASALLDSSILDFN